MSLPTNPINRKEAYLNAIATGNTADMPAKPITREEAYLDAIAKNGGGSGGAENYAQLSGKPQINNVELESGNNSLSALGIQGKLTFDNVPTDGSNNPVKSDGIYDSEKDIYAVMGEMGAKNLIVYPYVSSSNSYFQINSDGSITLKGANTSEQWLRVSDFYLKSGIYTMTASPSGNAHGVTIGIGSLNDQDEYTPITSTTYPKFSVSFRINKGTRVRVRLYRDANLDFTNNVVLYPMLRLASDTDDTYQRYAKTNKQLTDEIANKVDKVEGKGLSTNDYSDTEKGKVADNTAAIEAIVNEYGACNMITPYNAIITDADGIFTINADGSVTVNGTPSADSNIAFNISRIEQDVIVKGSGTGVTLAAHPLDGAWQIVNEGAVLHGVYPKGFSINVAAGVTVNNVTVYPMLYDARLKPTGYVKHAMTNRELTERVTQSEFVSIGTDGVKTQKQLMQDLYALVDLSKISMQSKFVLNNANSLSFFPLVEKALDNRFLCFMRTAVSNAVGEVIETYQLGDGSVYAGKAYGGVEHDTSSEVLSAGMSFAVYY